MARWFALIVIGMLVVSGISGGVAVVADENPAQNVARLVQAAIDSDELLRGSDIRVAAEKDTVTLYGEVADVAGVQHATAIAARSAAAHRVVARVIVTVAGSR